MTKSAFLGLGSMGAPMAAKLLDAGHTVQVWNRSPAKAAAARGLDLQVAAAANGWLEVATAAKLGDLDYSAVVAHIRQRPAR